MIDSFSDGLALYSLVGRGKIAGDEAEVMPNNEANDP